MTGFFKKLFGIGKKEEKGIGDLFQEVISGIIKIANFDIQYKVSLSSKEEGSKINVIRVDLFGNDEELFVEKEGQLMEAFQLYLTRIAQHHFPTELVQISIDCNEYKENSKNELLKLAEKAKNSVIEKGKPAFLKALPSKDRKIVHQFLSTDQRVKSRSVGDGMYKKIKIFPAAKGS